MNTALLIIDMQNDFVLPEGKLCIAGALATIPAINAVRQFFTHKSWPVFHIIREYRADGSDIELFRRKKFLAGSKAAVPGTWGQEIVNELTPQKDEYIIVKQRFSAFMLTELDLILRRLGIKKLAICGTQYPACVRASVMDGLALDYEIFLITDATSAKSPDVAEANIKDMQNLGVNCLSTAQFCSSFKSGRAAV